MKKKQLIVGLIILIVLYVIYKIISRTTYTPSNNPFLSEPRPAMDPSSVESALKGSCVEPGFADVDINGRECAGKQINENQILRLGDQGCDVLLLQQRLNNIESQGEILRPTGRFCCKTKARLMQVMGVPEITLNQFQPENQGGFNEMEGGTHLTNYSYMDANNLKK